MRPGCLLFVGQEHIDVVERVDVVCAGTECLGHLDDGIVRKCPRWNISEFSRANPWCVGFQVHRGVDEQVASFVIVGHLADRLAQDSRKAEMMSNDLRV